MNYRKSPAIILAAVLAILLSAGAPPLGAAPALLDRIVAVVDDDIVLHSELENETVSLIQQLRDAQVAMPSERVIREQALERLILKKLQVAQAAKVGIEVDDDTLTRALVQIAERNNLRMEDLRDTLARDGMNLQQFRERIREELIISQLQNREILNRIQISRAEVERYLAENDSALSGRKAFRLRHILISTPEGASPQQIEGAQQRAREVLAAWRDGAEFGALAQRHSDGRQALRGGDLGWLEAASVPTLFSQAVFQLERGEVAGPLQSGSGFHLIELVDYRGGDRSILTQTRVRHILIRTDELTSDDDARERLRRLRERILNGEDFATLARANSNDQASAIKGGDIGWANPGDMTERFEEVMDSLAPGEISAPFKTRFGWHIANVLERRQQDVTDELQLSKARQEIRNRKADESLELYLRRLRDEAYVDIRLDER